MNKNSKHVLFAALLGCGIAASLSSCKSGEPEFDDYEGGTTAYFATQYPVRTIVLGDDDYETTLDKAHKFEIKSTFGGSYNGSNGTVEIAVDPTLVNNLTFADGSPVKAMPTDYYSLSTTQLSYGGGFYGTTVVQLNDAFFADPLAVNATYVIPVKMIGQTGFKQILSGTLKEGATEVLTNSDAWDVQPKNFVLYCVKFQNKYSGYWLTNGNSSTDNIEKAKDVLIESRSLNACVYHASYTARNYVQYKRDANGNPTSETETVSKTYDFDLLLTFDASDNCVVASLSPVYTGGGSGSWKDDGEKKSWGNKDRDLMELNYQMDLGTDELGNTITANVQEKLVWQRSGVKSTEFTVIYTN